MTSRWCWRRCHNCCHLPQRLRIVEPSFRADRCRSRASGGRELSRSAIGHVPLVVVNYLGLPSVAVPSHLDASGPVGVQLIGRPLRGDLCLDVSQRQRPDEETLRESSVRVGISQSNAAAPVASPGRAGPVRSPMPDRGRSARDPRQCRPGSRVRERVHLGRLPTVRRRR